MTVPRDCVCVGGGSCCRIATNATRVSSQCCRAFYARTLGIRTSFGGGVQPVCSSPLRPRHATFSSNTGAVLPPRCCVCFFHPFPRVRVPWTNISTWWLPSFQTCKATCSGGEYAYYGLQFGKE